MSKLPQAFPGFKASIKTNLVVTPTKETKPFKAKKAGTNGSHFFLLLDESGSMYNLTKDTIGGVNSLLQEQSKDEILTNVTIVKFEGGNIKVPVENQNVKEITNFKDYQPAGGTNLLDAIGFTMEKVNSLLKKTKKNDRPSIFIQIITDGQENASRNYTSAMIKEMVKSAEKNDWVFTFVGANMDSFAEASQFGFNINNTANYNTSSTHDTYASISSSLSRMKGMRSLNVSANQIYTSGAVYSAEEKAKMNGGNE